MAYILSLSLSCHVDENRPNTSLISLSIEATHCARALSYSIATEKLHVFWYQYHRDDKGDKVEFAVITANINAVFIDIYV